MTQGVTFDLSEAFAKGAAEKAAKRARLRERFNSRNGGRWAGWQESFDRAEQAAGVTFTQGSGLMPSTVDQFFVIVCGDGSDARIYPKGKPHGP
jgi:hypothetical protein